MKIGILAAMDKEVALLLPLMSEMKETDLDGIKGYKGKVGHHDVLVMKCGIGKVNSALNAYRMIERFHPDLVINSGVAGGADASMRVGDLLVATQAAYHDVWCGPGTEWGHMDGTPARFELDPTVIESCRRFPDAGNFRFGLIATGDRFISNVEDLNHIKKIYPEALACDMESTAIAQICHACTVPFAVLRVVSDTPGQADNLSQYENFFSEAPEKTFRVIKSLLEVL